MRELAILSFLTVDGVMQSPSGPDEDPSEGFAEGGWARACWDEVMAQVATVAMAEPYDLLLGRTTYQMFASAFDGEGTKGGEAHLLTRLTKYVVAGGSTPMTWANSIRLEGNPADTVARLKADDGPLLQVHGSWRLVQTLLANDLIDEYRLWTFPAIVGSGKRLFAEGTAPRQLRLIRTDSTAGGAVMRIYRRASD